MHWILFELHSKVSWLTWSSNGRLHLWVHGRPLEYTGTVHVFWHGLFTAMEIVMACKWRPLHTASNPYQWAQGDLLTNSDHCSLCGLEVANCSVSIAARTRLLTLSHSSILCMYVTCGRAGHKTTCIYCFIFCSVPDLGKFVRTIESSEDDGSGRYTGELVTWLLLMGLHMQCTHILM